MCLIGENGMSVFAYYFANDCFEIRGKASMDYVIESYANFNALIDMVN
jgi:hypothetical protein